MSSDAPKPPPPPKTAWHPMFYIVVDEMLDPRFWQVLGEFLLHKEPLRVDLVVVRRKVKRPAPAPRQLHSVLGGLRAHNLIHLKGTTDELEADDALQLVEYTAGYMRAEGVRDASQIALRVVAPSLTPRFVRALAPWGSLAPMTLPGVHEGKLGAVSLRVIETALACELPHEEILALFTPQFLAGRRLHTPVDERERRLYNRLYRCVEQLAHSPMAAMIKDSDVTLKRWEEDIMEFLPSMNPSLVLNKFTPEQRLADLTPEQRLADLTPEQAVLALPDAALRGLSEAYIATLPDDVRARILARLAR